MDSPSAWCATKEDRDGGLFRAVLSVHVVVGSSARFGDTIRVFEASETTRFHATDRCVVFMKDNREYVLEDSG
jgi:hypothetical protein